MSRLFEKVKAISEEQEWPELLSMVMDQVMDGINEETPDNKLFNQESFLMRLCLRYEHFKKAPFNIVVLMKKDLEDYVRIGNYDYKTYVWAKKVYDMDDYCTVQVCNLDKSGVAEIHRLSESEKLRQMYIQMLVDGDE
jgi:hypothetical protein